MRMPVSGAELQCESAQARHSEQMIF